MMRQKITLRLAKDHIETQDDDETKVVLSTNDQIKWKDPPQRVLSLIDTTENPV